MFRKSLFLNRMSMTRAMRYTPPTMKAAPLMLPIASPIRTVKANAKTPSTISRSRMMTRTASTLLKPTDRLVTMFFLKSSVLMLRYSPIVEDRIPQNCLVLFHQSSSRASSKAFFEFRGQTGDKIEMQILTKPYITIS